ncbi:MAG TPA: hypothetical protein VFU17_03370 [Candidatus Limnocylindrales bacterium]|nr:hypothetical protein [Candidatus Limnocylindrales bacterium]
MDDLTLMALVAAAVVGLIASIMVLRHERQVAEATAGDVEAHSFAVATEGMKRCPSCGMGNLVTDRTCAACKKPLPA